MKLAHSTQSRPLTTLATLGLSALANITLWMFAHAADIEPQWPRWRGPDDLGSTTAGKYPESLSASNTLWKIELPGKGCSTPIVWNRNIYLTAPINGKDALLAYDWDGRPLWQTTFGPENAGRHRNGSGSNPSAVTDGSGLYVNYKSGTLAAVEWDGKIRWQTNLVARFGPDTLFWDHGTSPVLTEDSVVMARMHHGNSWLIAFDKKSGEQKWKIDRNFETPTEGDHGYSTPIVTRQAGKEILLVWGAEHVTAHDARAGGIVWKCGDFNPEKTGFWPAVSTPVLVDHMLVVSYGRSDRNQPRLHGLRLTGAEGDPSGERVWQRNDTGTFVPSLAAYQGKAYVLRDRGELECIDPKTGKTEWRDAFPKSSSSFYASPTLADGKLYAAREDGHVFVARVTPKFELLSQNRFSERIIASPVPIHGRLLIRGEQHLHALADVK